MGRILCTLFLCIFTAAVSAATDMDITYSVKVDNLSRASVVFKLDGGKPCTARPQETCSWDIPYGSHHLEAAVGGKLYTRDFELSDESDIQVHCIFDGSSFGGDSC